MSRFKELRYVERDARGKVIGHFANEQSYAREALLDDHPDLLDFQARRDLARTEAEKRSLSKVVPALEARVKALEELVETLRSRL